MHTFKQSSFGFHDADLQSRDHDATCRYLASSDEIAQALIRELTGRTVMLVGRRDLERPIMKGEGKFRTNVGFIDVQIAGMFADDNRRFVANIEVKQRFVTACELLRQINLYREFSPPDWLWCAVLGFPAKAEYLETLRSQHVFVITLEQALDGSVVFQSSTDANGFRLAA